MLLARSLAPGAFFVAALTASACGRRMTQSDCERIGTHLREIWDADVAAAAPRSEDERPSELADLVIKSHRERISNEWMNQCRRELEGRPVDDKEIECILSAKAIADVQACASMPKP
jgi:hypothetical protein